MHVIDEREISPGHRVALGAFGKVPAEPETSGAEVPKTHKEKPQLLRLITTEEVESLGLQVACAGCNNGCLGGSEVEVYQKQAVACRPTDEGGIIGLRVGFVHGFKPSKLFCFQPQDGENAVQIDLGTRVKTVSKSRERVKV